LKFPCLKAMLGNWTTTLQMLPKDSKSVSNMSRHSTQRINRVDSHWTKTKNYLTRQFVPLLLSLNYLPIFLEKSLFYLKLTCFESNAIHYKNRSCEKLKSQVLTTTNLFVKVSVHNYQCKNLRLNVSLMLLVIEITWRNLVHTQFLPESRWR